MNLESTWLISKSLKVNKSILCKTLTILVTKEMFLLSLLILVVDDFGSLPSPGRNLGLSIKYSKELLFQLL